MLLVFFRVFLNVVTDILKPLYHAGRAPTALWPIVPASTRWRLNGLALAFVFVMAPALAAAEAGTFDVGGKVIDIGVQPLAFPIAMFGEVIKRDRILRAQLAKTGWSVRQHRYSKGNDMLDHLGRDELEAAMLGDIPTINAMSFYNMLAVGLLKHGFSSVVINRFASLADLKGKKVGNGFGSTAHYTLLEGLATVGLSEKDLQLVEISVSDMPAALASGKIDAYSAWEPTPTIDWTKNPEHFVAYRGVNNAYLVLSRKLVEQQPQVAREFLAAFPRALYWMKKSSNNLRQAAQWALQAHQETTRKAPDLSVEQAMQTAKREAVDIPGAPMLPRTEATSAGRMANQLRFLKHIGKIPETVFWDGVVTNFAPQLMEEVLRQPARYRVFAYDYEL